MIIKARQEMIIQGLVLRIMIVALLAIIIFNLSCSTFHNDRWDIKPVEKKSRIGQIISLEGLVPEQVWSVYRHMSDEQPTIFPPLIILYIDPDLPGPEQKLVQQGGCYARKPLAVLHA